MRRPLVADRHPETLDLEAKGKADPAKGRLDKEDRKNFAEAVSGFANSDGGVLVWGLVARRGRDRRIQGLAAIKELQDFRVALEGELADSVTPSIDGLEIATIEDPGRPGTGVVLCLIPASDGGPHMARAKGQHTYFRRNAARSCLWSTSRSRTCSGGAPTGTSFPTWIGASR